MAGVTVGHCTLDDGDVQTGVTVVRPHAGDLFRDRVPAAAVVLNGFGKSVGLMQVEELGVLETPIALTNTFSVAGRGDGADRASASPPTRKAGAACPPSIRWCSSATTAISTTSSAWR